jgi:uncharacterized protein YigE (DUF2233 family)
MRISTLAVTPPKLPPKDSSVLSATTFRDCAVRTSTRLQLGLAAVALATCIASWIPFGSLAHAAKGSQTGDSTALTCSPAPSSAQPLSCVPFQGHLYAVANIDLRSHEIVFTSPDDAQMHAYPDVVEGLSRSGLTPILVTNGGIYGTDNRPLGLLISPQGKKHELNTRAGTGNFSWDSAVFQTFTDGTASIVSARSWQPSPRVTAATQSGPQLAISGKINQGFRPQSQWSFTRTAIGVDLSDSHLVHLAVSREPVTLFELATFMVDKLHCSEALHLDGDLSAFYIPSAQGKFVFSDPGARLVTVLSVVERNTDKPRHK